MGYVHGEFPTLVWHYVAGIGVLQKLQQKRFHNIRAAMESCQDIQEPPSSLTTVPVEKCAGRLKSGCQRLHLTRDGKCLGVLQFGAGVGSDLLHHLAIGFIFNQAMFTT